jgi:hypothetical protein
MRTEIYATLLLPTLLLGACGGEAPLSEQVNDFGGRGSNNANSQLPTVTDLLDLSPPPPNPQRSAYFGDLHVHTEYSFDAYNFGTTATPYDAYRYAKGEAIAHPSGYQVQLRTPLDFYAVTDHAMFLGLVKEAADTSTAFSKYPVSRPIHNINDPDNMGITSVLGRVTPVAISASMEPFCMPARVSGMKPAKFFTRPSTLAIPILSGSLMLWMGWDTGYFENAVLVSAASFTRPRNMA